MEATISSIEKISSFTCIASFSLNKSEKFWSINKIFLIIFEFIFFVILFLNVIFKWSNISSVYYLVSWVSLKEYLK